MTLEQTLDAIRNAFGSIDSIIVTDRDGVEIVSSPADTLSESEKRQNIQIISTIFTLTHEQCSKLDEFGPAKYVISEFGESKVMLQANTPPTVITIQADRRSVSDAQLVEAARSVSTEVSRLKLT
jgi:hypothetical protein